MYHSIPFSPIIVHNRCICMCTGICIVVVALIAVAAVAFVNKNHCDFFATFRYIYLLAFLYIKLATVKHFKWHIYQTFLLYCEKNDVNRCIGTLIRFLALSSIFSTKY